MVIKTEENNLVNVVPMSILAYKNQRVMMRLKELSSAMRQAETDQDMERLSKYFSQYMALSEVKKKLGKALGKRIIN